MKSFLKSFQFFYRIIGGKIYISWALLVLGTIFEGIGISLFYPILKNGVSGDDVISKKILLFMNYFNLDYSLTLMLKIIFVVLFIRAFLLICQRWYNAWLMSGISASLQLQIVKGYFDVDYTYVLGQKSGYVVNALARELPQVSAAYKMFSAILSSLVITTVYLSIPLLLNLQATLYLLAFGCLMLVIMVPINRILKRNSLKNSDLSGILQNYVIQSLSFYKYLKSTNNFSRIISKIEKNIEKVRRIQYLESGPLDAVPHYGLEFVAFSLVIVMIYFQSVVYQNDVDSQLFILLLLYRGVSVLLGLQMYYRKLLTYAGSIEVYNNLKSGVDTNKEVLNKNGVQANFNNKIIFEKVSFNYNKVGSNTLKDIDIVIKPKSTVGIVGDSGSGKSTLMSLLTGILKPDNGVLKIGKLAYKDHNILDIRSKIGYVTQENIIFNDTIFNNISLWDENTSNLKIEESAKKALAYDFIMDQPKKFEQQLGDNGINLSGGQRQRITIARELFKNSEILVFDEATSALDSESEKNVQESIDQLKGKKTILIISHRLFTLKCCDIIYVLNKGKVVDSGNFNELLTTSDEFKKMFNIQKLK